MNLLKGIYGLCLLLFAVRALGYARYLHDEEENRGGAVLVFVIAVLTTAAVWQIRG